MRDAAHRCGKSRLVAALAIGLAACAGPESSPPDVGTLDTAEVVAAPPPATTVDPGSVEPPPPPPPAPPPDEPHEPLRDPGPPAPDGPPGERPPPPRTAAAGPGRGFRTDSVYRELPQAAIDLRVPPLQVDRMDVVRLTIRVGQAGGPDTLVVQADGTRRFESTMKAGEYMRACLRGRSFVVESVTGEGACAEQLLTTVDPNVFSWSVTPEPGDTVRTLLLSVEAIVDGERRHVVHARDYPVAVAVAPCGVACRLTAWKDGVTLVQGLVGGALAVASMTLVPLWRRLRGHSAGARPPAPARQPDGGRWAAMLHRRRRE